MDKYVAGVLAIGWIGFFLNYPYLTSNTTIGAFLTTGLTIVNVVGILAGGSK
jgi:hypothetical protein